MFHVGCRKVSKILKNISMEPISKLDVHYLSKTISSKLKIALEFRIKV